MVIEALSAIADFARERGLRWYVFGAQAVLVHGVPRLTADIDVTIDAGELCARELVSSLESFGLVSRAVGFDLLLETSRLLPLVHAASHTPVDLVLAGRGIEQDFLARAAHVNLGGFDVPILSAEDLIATKVITVRRKDREDVLGILETQGTRLDRALLARTLAEVDASLEEPRASKSFARIDRLYRRRLESR